jgi:hypothetical protein
MRTVPLHLVAREAITEQQRRFEKKFGRKMGPGDPIFFDPDADVPQALRSGQSRGCNAQSNERGRPSA